ncbi:GIN domain-containing protein [Litorimonas sp.]|uniref:GIN domain-containing protein n=1 Tax=Litorimonas sp. TaxID=1892381 RepID=UPI003A85FF3B
MPIFAHKNFIASTLLSLPLLMPSSAGADEKPEVLIEDFVGTIIWSNGGQQAEITNRKKASSVDASNEGNGLIINGGVRSPDGDKCQGYGGSYNFSFFGNKEKKGVFGGYEDLEDYPTLTLSLPVDVSLKLRNSIVFSQGTPDIYSADLSLIHCGAINLGRLSGDMDVEGRGAADLTFTGSRNLSSQMSGSGDIKAESVKYLKAESNGSGDLAIGETENADVRTSGSGDVEIKTISGSAIIETSGSGDYEIGSIAGSLDYRSSGSGDLELKRIGGEGTNRVGLKSAGSGDIYIGSGEITNLYVDVSGSADAEINAIVRDAVAKASGSADIYFDTVNGSLEKTTSGSSDIEVDHRN